MRIRQVQNEGYTLERLECAGNSPESIAKAGKWGDAKRSSKVQIPGGICAVSNLAVDR